jgi:hypothetical protein
MHISFRVKLYYSRVDLPVIKFCAVGGCVDSRKAGRGTCVRERSKGEEKHHHHHRAPEPWVDWARKAKKKEERSLE